MLKKRRAQCKQGCLISQLLACLEKILADGDRKRAAELVETFDWSQLFSTLNGQHKLRSARSRAMLLLDLLPSSSPAQCAHILTPTYPNAPHTVAKTHTVDPLQGSARIVMTMKEASLVLQEAQPHLWRQSQMQDLEMSNELHQAQRSPGEIPRKY